MTGETNSSLSVSLLQQSRGRSAFGCLVLLIFLGAIGYVGYKFGEVYWNYLDVRQKVREALNWSVANQAKTDQEMYARIVANVRETGLELGPRNVRITHSKENLTFTVTYSQSIVFPYYTIPLNFNISLTEIKRWTSGPLIFKY